MEKTLFAGLTQLDPGESLSTDNASFQSENPPKIDRLLEIGAVTHRHDAHAQQANPGSALAPTASAVASGGFIPADLTVYVGFTLLDFDQGETTLSPIVTVSTDAPLPGPDDGPTAEADYTAGGLVADTYYYALSLLDAEGGETPLGPTTAVERVPGYASGRVLLSDLLAPVVDAGAAGWRLWRAVGGGDLFYIASGATDTYVDDGSACVDCTLAPVNPDSNLTNGDNTILVEIPSGGAMATASAFSVYLTTDSGFDSGALAGTYPIASAGTVLTFRDLIVEDHRPPDVSTCIPGASQIDPDTELIDWHWKRPVANVAALPVDAEEGDVRVVLDGGLPYRYIDGAWGIWDLSGTGVEVAGPGGADLSAINKVTFAASGAAHVGVAAGAAGEAIVTVHANSAAAGGGGSAGIAIHYSKVVHDDITDIEFAPDGLRAEVEFDPDTGTFATIIHKPPARTFTDALVTLASGATEDNVLAFAPAYRLMHVVADKACRVRLYTDIDARDADSSRAIGVEPTGDHGVVYEHLFPAGELTHRVVPNVCGAVLDNLGGGIADIPLSITNMGATGDVNLTFLWQQLEAFS